MDNKSASQQRHSEMGAVIRNDLIPLIGEIGQYALINTANKAREKIAGIDERAGYAAFMAVVVPIGLAHIAKDKIQDQFN